MRALLLFWIAAAFLRQEGAFVEVIGDVGFTPWKKPTGGWMLAGDVSIDPADPKKLAWKEGRGIIFNGKDGKTSNLFLDLDLKDVELHVEFTVSKGSNSGVYLMGRYEIQILDSWGVKEPHYSDCGGIYQRWDPKRGKGKEGYEGHPPKVNASAYMLRVSE